MDNNMRMNGTIYLPLPHLLASTAATDGIFVSSRSLDILLAQLDDFLVWSFSFVKCD